MVEQRIRNAKVGSSTLLTGTMKKSGKVRHGPNAKAWALLFLVCTLTCKREVVKPNIAVAIPARCMTERSSPFQLLLRAATSATAGVRAWRAALVLLIAAIRVLALMPVPPPGLTVRATCSAIR